MIPGIRGIAAARLAKTLFYGETVDRSPGAALAFAEKAISTDWRDTPSVAWVLRSAVDTISGSGSGEFLHADVGIDFSAAVRPASLLGRITGFRTVPLRTRLLSGIGGTTARWCGEGLPVGISSASFEDLILQRMKTVSIAVVTKELLKASTPKADAVLRDDMAAATAEALDQAFIDPYNAGIPGAVPPSVTNGATPIASSGDSIAQIDADLAAMVLQLTDAGSSLEHGAWIMRPNTAVSLSQKRGTNGTLAYPGMTAKGGELLGLPVHTSNKLPQDTAGGFIVLLDASEIAVGDDGEAEFVVSDRVSLRMSDNASTHLANVFQADAAAVKIVRYLNWHLRQAGFVSVLSGVDY